VSLSTAKRELIEARTALGMSQRQLADAIPCELRSLQNWEQAGREEPPAWIWCQLGAVKGRRQRIAKMKGGK